ncbi:hypothetical protein BH09ACT6_BH09ACT6_15840 [soil metagenome]
MPERTVSVFDSILRLLWHGVEIYVFVVLIVKDHKIPSWTAGRQLPKHSPVRAVNVRPELVEGERAGQGHSVQSGRERALSR